MPPGYPNRAPVNRDATFPEPSFHYLSQFPVNGPPPQVSQWDPYGERHPSTEPSTSHPLKIHLSFRVRGKGDPSMFPNRVCMERDILSPEALVYLFIYVCQSPQKRIPSKKWGNIRSLSMEPHADRRPTYNRVWSGSPRGSLTTLLSLPQCHAALSMILSTLAWGDQSPVRQHVS
jgi:hypothetical protein